jgi:hypothetical protein
MQWPSPGRGGALKSNRSTGRGMKPLGTPQVDGAGRPPGRPATPTQRVDASKTVTPAPARAATPSPAGADVRCRARPRSAYRRDLLAGRLPGLRRRRLCHRRQARRRRRLPRALTASCDTDRSGTIAPDRKSAVTNRFRLPAFTQLGSRTAPLPALSHCARSDTTTVGRPDYRWCLIAIARLRSCGPRAALLLIVQSGS